MKPLIIAATLFAIAAPATAQPIIDQGAQTAMSAAAAACLAAAPAVVRDSVTVTCSAGGTNALPRRGTDAAGQVVTTCTGTGLVVTAESTADHPCAAYIRALATSDAPTESGE